MTAVTKNNWFSENNKILESRPSASFPLRSLRILLIPTYHDQQELLCHILCVNGDWKNAILHQTESISWYLSSMVGSFFTSKAVRPRSKIHQLMSSCLKKHPMEALHSKSYVQIRERRWKRSVSIAQCTAQYSLQLIGRR